MYGYGQTTSLKYFKRLNVYKNSTGSCVFYPETLIADSYGHWEFVKRIRGKVVFNDYNYSPTTSAHQSCVRSLLKELKIKIDYTVNTRCSLDRFKDEALKPEYEKLFELEIELNNPHSNKKKRVYRLDVIKEIKGTIKGLRKLGAEFTKVKQKQLKLKLERNEKERIERMRNTRKIKIELNKVEMKQAKKEMKDLGTVDLKFSQQANLGPIKF